MKTIKEEPENFPLVPMIKEPVHKTQKESRKLIQKQLVLLLHSHSCLKKDLALPNRPKCNVPNCRMMQDVWGHIKECKTGPECSHIHCLSSLKILAHWKHCKDVECSVCKLVRLKGAQQLELQARKPCRVMRDVGGGIVGVATKFEHENSNIKRVLPNTADTGQSTSLPYQGLMSQCQGQSQPQPGNESLESYCLNYSDNSNAFHCNKNHNRFYGSHSLSTHPYLPSSSSGLYYWPHSRHTNNCSDPITDDMTLGIPLPLVPPIPFHLRQFPLHSSHQGQYGESTFSQMSMSNQGCFQNSDQRFRFCPCGQNCLYSMSDMDEQKELSTETGSFPPSHVEGRFQGTPPEDALPAPSANDVREAYEQLGIPCPVDALRRLMATLPGGGSIPIVDPSPSDSEKVENGVLIGNGAISRLRYSNDTDDGIHDTASIDGDDDTGNPWCASLLIRRLILNGKRREIVASSSS